MAQPLPPPSGGGAVGRLGRPTSPAGAPPSTAIAGAKAGTGELRPRPVPPPRCGGGDGVTFAAAVGGGGAVVGWGAAVDGDRRTSKGERRDGRRVAAVDFCLLLPVGSVVGVEQNISLECVRVKNLK